MEKCLIHDSMIEQLKRIENKIDGLAEVSVINGNNTHITFDRNEFH